MALCAVALEGFDTARLRLAAGLARVAIRIVQALASHDAKAGAMPILLAATGREVKKLDYYGPSKMLEQKGPPKLVRVPRRASDNEVAKRLWDVSEQLTGVTYGEV